MTGYDPRPEVIREMLKAYVPDGYRDEDGVWNEGPNLGAALSALDALVAERDLAVGKLDEIGAFAASHSGRDGQDVLLAALYRIAEECETRAALSDSKEKE